MLSQAFFYVPKTMLHDAKLPATKKAWTLLTTAETNKKENMESEIDTLQVDSLWKHRQVQPLFLCHTKKNDA